uniref:hypothetical protein n=1 Tax=Bacillus thuringiensis TaxID=1428 RepID=UPI0016434124
GWIRVDLRFDGSGLEEKEVVVFEEVRKEGKVVGSESDIEDKGERVKFVKGCVERRGRKKEDGWKELEGKNVV